MIIDLCLDACYKKSKLQIQKSYSNSSFQWNKYFAFIRNALNKKYILKVQMGFAIVKWNIWTFKSWHNIL